MGQKWAQKDLAGAAARVAIQAFERTLTHLSIWIKYWVLCNSNCCPILEYYSP